MAQNYENSLWNYSETLDSTTFGEKTLNVSNIVQHTSISLDLEMFENPKGLVMKESVLQWRRHKVLAMLYECISSA